MSCDEIRRESWTALWQGRWLGRIVGTVAIVMLPYVLVALALQAAFVANGIEGLDKYFNACQRAMLAGQPLPPFESAAGVRMTGAWLFTSFINYIFAGILSFATARVALKCVRGDAERCLADAWAGYRSPFGMGWLAFFTNLRIALWSLLLLVPGIVAFYRYILAWYVKCDHPEWSAWACLRESGRLMKGNKWRCFSLECSYWKSALLFLLPMLLLSIVGATGLVAGALTPGLGAGMGIFSMAAFAGFLVFCVHLGVGHAIFYRELAKDSPSI